MAVAPRDVFATLPESVVGDADDVVGSGVVAADDGGVGQPTDEPESGGSRLAPSSTAHMGSRSRA